MRPLLTLVFATAWLVPIRAADPVFSAPLLGTVFDQQVKGFRALFGVPGAVDFGGPLPGLEPLELACTDPHTRAGIGVTKDGRVVFIRWAGGQYELSPLADVVDPAENCVASENSGVLFGKNGVRIWTRLTDTEPGLTMYTVDSLGGAPAATAALGGGRFAVLLRSGELVELGDGVRVTGLTGNAIASNGKDLFVLNEQGTLFQLNGADSLVITENLDSDSLLIADRERVIALSRDTGHAAVVWLDPRRRSDFDLECRPARVSPLALAGLWYVTDRDGNNWILDGASGAVILQRLTPFAGGAR